LSFLLWVLLSPPAVALPNHMALLLRPRKQLAPPTAQEGSSSKQLLPTTPDGPPVPTLVPGRLGSRPAHATKTLDLARATDGAARLKSESTCVVGCLHADSDHVGLCITTDGVVPPSIKRSHARFKEQGSLLLLSVDLLWQATNNDKEESAKPLAKRLRWEDMD